MNLVSGEEVALRYLKFGLAYTDKGLVQGDIQVGIRKTEQGFEQAQLCNFHCGVSVNGKPTGGKYVCPAGLYHPKNKGTKLTTIPSVDHAVETFLLFAEGIDEAHARYLSEGHFDLYCQKAKVPDWAIPHLRHLVEGKGKVRGNIFGGNAEVNKQIEQIIARLVKAGMVVDLSTVGARILNEDGFLDLIAETPPNGVVAMSVDDAESPEQLEKLFDMSRDKLKDEFNATDKFFGQRRKLIAAVGAAKRLQDEGFPATVLFNNVVQPDNIYWIYRLEQIISQRLPKAKINFYPLQFIFNQGTNPWSKGEIELLSVFVDYMIERTKNLDNPSLTVRLHYWWALRATLDYFKDNWESAAAGLSGKGVWNCYSGASLTGQFGGTYPEIVDSTESPQVQLTGNCFWNNDTVNAGKPFLSSSQVANYYLTDRVRLAAESKQKCGGCQYPRLEGDEFDMAPGLADPINERYLALRDEFIYN